MQLLEEIREFLPVGSSVNGKSLVPEEMLLIYLWYHTGNSFVRHDKRSHSCSHGSICKSIDLVIRAFHESTIERKNFVHRQVRLPTPEEALKEAMDFQEKSNFPPVPNNPIVFASVDGTHIKGMPLCTIFTVILTFLRKYCTIMFSITVLFLKSGIDSFT